MSTPQRARDKAIELIRKMRMQTTDRGVSPSEAAGFAAKTAEWLERYQITEAELAAKDGEPLAPEVQFCQHKLRTGKKVFNPGMTAVVNSLAVGMCCEVLMTHESNEAVYLILGDELDTSYVIQIASVVVPALLMSAKLEGAEHGEEKAGLIRWCNQYLSGAGTEIQRRLEQGRQERSELKEVEAKVSGTALVPVTGTTIATAKRTFVEQKVKEMYPRTKTTHSKSSYNATARERGRAAGKRVGLNIPLEDKE